MVGENRHCKLRGRVVDYGEEADGERHEVDWNELPLEIVRKGMQAKWSEMRLAFIEDEWVEDEMANCLVAERLPYVNVCGGEECGGEGSAMVRNLSGWR